MRFTSFAATFLAIGAVFAQNNTILVQVGANGGLTYDPPSVMANVGDIVAFQFMAKNHTVTQSTFASPCAIMTTPAPGIDSGFQAVAANATEIPQWSFQVTNASVPLWFYCAQVGHCSKGMVFAVNPTATKNYTAFLANAMASATNTSTGTNSTGTGTNSTSPSGSSPSAASENLPSASVSGNLGGALGLRGSNVAVVSTVLALVASLVL